MFLVTRRLAIFVKIQNRLMARLGRQVDHFENIDIDSIKADFSTDRKYRYTLSMRYNHDLLSGERTKCVTVILKNPSSADEKRADSTIRKVETYVWQRFPDAGFLNIYNIFAFRATDAIELHHLMLDNGLESGVGEENDSFLEELLSASDYLVCAWGGPSAINREKYQARIHQVKKIITEKFEGPVFHVQGKQETAEPLHGLMWGYDYELKDFKV